MQVIRYTFRDVDEGNRNEENKATAIPLFLPIRPPIIKSKLSAKIVLCIIKLHAYLTELSHLQTCELHIKWQLWTKCQTIALVFFLNVKYS